ncbi:MAG: hypothetical protein U0Y10_24770 [Spirosomataceae bacterium]
MKKWLNGSLQKYSKKEGQKIPDVRYFWAFFENKLVIFQYKIVLFLFQFVAFPLFSGRGILLDKELKIVLFQ